MINASRVGWFGCISPLKDESLTRVTQMVTQTVPSELPSSLLKSLHQDFSIFRGQIRQINDSALFYTPSIQNGYRHYPTDSLLDQKIR